MAFNPLDYLKNLVPENTNMFGASPNANMKKMYDMGLLGDTDYKTMLEKANKQSIFQGLLSSGLAYAAQPKNQGYGSIFPYLAKAGLAGVQAAQSPYDQMGQDAMMNQKLQEMKRANDLRIAEADFRKGVLPPQGSSVVNPNAQVRLAPEINVTNQDYGIGSSLMGGRNTPTTLNPVSPNFGLKSVNAPLAQTLGVSEAQLPKTTSTADPEEVNLHKRFTSGLSSYEQYMAAKKDLLASKKLQYTEEDTTKRLVTVDPITGQRKTVREAAPKVDLTPLEKNWEAMVRYGNTGKYNTFSDYVAANTTAAGVAPQQQILNDTFKSTVQGIVDTANSNRSVASQIDTINALLKDKPGGGIVKVSADLQSFLGLETPNANVNQIIEALRTRGGVQVRAPGSGSTSDLEFKSYMTTFPSLSTTPKGRELMGLVAEAGAKRSAKLADWSSQEFAKGTFSYERLRAYDEGLGKVLSDDIAKKIREQVEISGGTFVPYNDVFKKADSLILGVNN